MGQEVDQAKCEGPRSTLPEKWAGTAQQQLVAEQQQNKGQPLCQLKKNNKTVVMPMQLTREGTPLESCISLLICGQ